MKYEEIHATYHGMNYVFDNASGCMLIGMAIMHVEGEDDKPIKIKGQLDEPSELHLNMTYRFYGRWTEYRNRHTGRAEKQFQFSSYVEAAPVSRSAMISYIVRHGKGLHIGPVRAAKLANEFGLDLVKVCRTQPERVVEATKGVSIEDAQELANRLTQQYATEQMSIELIDLLDGRGFPKTITMKAIKRWGVEAANLIRKNPYLLMRFRGCGFLLTDKMYLDLGGKRDALKRQALCAWHAVASNTSGSTWFDAGICASAIKETAGSGAQVDKAFELARRSGMLSFAQVNSDGIIVQDGGRLIVAERVKADRELDISTLVVAREPFGSSWPDVSEISDCTPHQIEQLRKATRGKIGLFGGSPGCGKTYVAARLISKLLSEGRKVKVCAPTGKAAVRITESMREYGIDIKAKTIHSTLGVLDGGDDGWTFQHGPMNPLDADVVLVDEVSMVDTSLMASLLVAINRSTDVLFVGDVNQLPPVGHGAPYRDMINIGLPYGELREIHRNDGGIVQACADIRDGKKFQPGGNLSLLSAAMAETFMNYAVSIFNYAKRNGSEDPIWDTQVLVPVNKRSALSRVKMNVMLQREVNTSPGRSCIFAVGDKVICLKNGYYPLADKNDVDLDDEELIVNKQGNVYVANGEMGIIVEAGPYRSVVRLRNPKRTVLIVHGKRKQDDEQDGGSNWVLAYAITAHKSQGDQWPYVGVILDEYPGARYVFCREAIYTAISRAQKECMLIGKLETAWSFCRKTQINERFTLLPNRVDSSRSELFCFNM